MKSKKQRDEEKKLILDETEKLTPEQQKVSDQQTIFNETEALTPQQLKDKTKEAEKRLIELSGGGTISIKEVKDFAASIREPYQPHFQSEKGFFTGVYRLKGWPLEECKKFVKRREVACIIMRLIYSRYHPEIVEHIKKENPFLFSHIRKYKHFQFITKEGQIVLDRIIEDMVMMMIGYSDWDTFEYDYCTKHNLTYQRKIA